MTVHHDNQNRNGISVVNQLMDKTAHGTTEHNPAASAAAIAADDQADARQTMLALVAERAYAHYTSDDMHRRIARAIDLIEADHVVMDESGAKGTVLSSDRTRTYAVNGACPCADQDAEDGMCKHRLAVCMTYEVNRLLQPVEPTPAPTQTTSEHVAPFVEVSAEVYVRIGQGHKTKFVVKAGSAEACKAEVERLLAAYAA